MKFVRSKEKKPCWVCKKPTKRIDIHYEQPVCSKGCLDKMDRSYEDYLKEVTTL